MTHLLRNGCERLIFSSSAAIYRAGDDLSVDEDSPIDPQSPYARTKAVCESMFADIAAAEPIRVVSLRYFNPIGADPAMRTGLQLPRPTHALGQMIRARDEGVPFLVTGTDYPTRDGSGLRDYVHVWDLAAAHVAALGRFDTLPLPATAINLGTGRGTTVLELLDAFNRVSDSPIRARDAERRQATWPVPTPAAIALSAFSAGYRGTTLTMASVILCSGPVCRPVNYRTPEYCCTLPLSRPLALRRFRGSQQSLPALSLLAAPRRQPGNCRCSSLWGTLPRNRLGKGRPECRQRADRHQRC